MTFIKYLIKYSIVPAVLLTAPCSGGEKPLLSADIIKQALVKNVQDTGIVARVNSLSLRLEERLKAGDLVKGKIIADSLISLIGQRKDLDDKYLVYPFYMLGSKYAVSREYSAALEYYRKAILLLKRFPDAKLEGRVYYMMALSSSEIGDYYNAARFSRISLDLKINQYGGLDPELITEYISVAANNSGIRNYKQAIEYADQGLKVVKANPETVTPLYEAILYQVKGIALMEIGDYNKANLNCEVAYEIFEKNSLQSNERYISILDNLGTSFYYMMKFDKCSYYYNKGIAARSEINGMYINLCYNYAIILANQKREAEGEKVLASVLVKAGKSSTGEIRDYFDLLGKYADYLREYKIDLIKARELYNDCYGYLFKNPGDIILKNNIALGYAQVLLDLDQPEEALDSIQSLIKQNSTGFKPSGPYPNPELENLKPDKLIWDILGVKYKILRRMYAAGNKFELLENAARTADLRISVFEQIRIKIGEEESRLLIGSSNREAYLDGIQSYNACFKLSGNIEFLEKAFELSEKSKAASLLASTREMKAVKFHIPMDKAVLEGSLQKEIALYEAEVIKESNNIKPDPDKLSRWRDYILTASRQSDSLKDYFEKNYPDYYALKYNTRVIKTGDVTKLLGKNSNYISYVVSDTSLYILLINKKYKKLVTVKTGEDFFNTVTVFRKLLSEPALDGNMREEFNDFQETGYKLQKILIDPVKQYFISGNLIISPDNVLAYFPFEVLITDSVRSSKLYYGKLSYLMNKYRISYAYSATFLSESSKTKPSFFNRLIAFAPEYKNLIYVDSLSVNRQSSNRPLADLKYAREEAEAVSEITSGKLFLGNQATESAYKSEAGKYDIIHLAMHTVIMNDDPINSGMIFSAGKDSTDGRSLGTYEITGIPLKAKMVVLSSCYTGTGEMFKGEGVLSLARGFIFSGSKSVVMSLWEVNDRSGTGIIESFYKNLKAGKSKSNALRKARLRYLKEADQLHSHPFFWSTLVIYGDDSPLYYSLLTKLAIVIVLLLITISGAVYLKKR